MPDTSINVFVSSQSDPPQSEFDRNPVLHNFGKHIMPNVDCLGFQRIPKFANNPGNSLGTGCFQVTQAPGDYTFQWSVVGVIVMWSLIQFCLQITNSSPKFDISFTDIISSVFVSFVFVIAFFFSFQRNWQFNEGSWYKTCFDAKVIPSTGRQASIPLTGYPNVQDTLGKGGSTCSENWSQEDAKFFSQIRNAAPQRSNQQQSTQTQTQQPTRQINQPSNNQQGGGGNSQGNSNSVAQQLAKRILADETTLIAQQQQIAQLTQQIKALQA
jgi:hypothetical protein